MKAKAEGDAKARPCPFCGKEVRPDVQYAFDAVSGKRTTPILHVVGCLSCEVFMFDNREDRLLERWNARETSQSNP